MNIQLTQIFKKFAFREQQFYGCNMAISLTKFHMRVIADRIPGESNVQQFVPIYMNQNIRVPHY